MPTAEGGELIRTAAASGTPKLFARDYVRSPIAGVPALAWRPGSDHPWENDRRTRVTAAPRRLIIAG